jgi:hypothetical protein
MHRPAPPPVAPSPEEGLPLQFSKHRFPALNIFSGV